MNLEAILDLSLLRALYGFIAFITVAFFYQRYRWRCRNGRRKSKWGFYPSTMSMGNAFQQLSVIAQPQAEHVLEEKLSEDSEEDDEGAPKDPVAHLHRQAAKLKRGEKLKYLTAVRKP